jgi:hypothetical protein
MNKETKKKTLTLNTRVKRNRDANFRKKGNSITVVAMKKAKKVPKAQEKKVLPKKVMIQRKPKGPAFIPAKERLPLEEAISEMKKYWPQIFPEGKLVPMQVGIKKKLKADHRERALPVNWERIKACLRGIGNSLAYHELIVVGAKRYDKDGREVDIVSEGAVAYSKKKMKQIKKNAK